MVPNTGSQTGPSDDALLDRARSGDRDAGAALLMRYRGRLVGFCQRYLGTLDAADDAVQDILGRVTIEKRWPSISFRAWIYRVARNHCLNQRKRSGLEATFGVTDLVSPRTGPRTAVDRSERDEALRTALAALPPAFAEVLGLRYFQELSRREMADVLEVSEVAVKEQLARARRELARKLDTGFAP